MKRFIVVGGLLLVLAFTAVPTLAQWNPSGGSWGKTDPNDVRIMSWNIRDHICSTANKAEALSGWAALAHIVAAMKPDVLMLYEAADNSGNGTGTGVDSAATLTTVLNLFLHGGTDPFLGGTVGAYVQKYDAAYDLPYVYVSTIDDGYNRNAILSRIPFGDLNGDGISQKSDIHFVLPDLYAPGGQGGIRGFMFCEFNLPDAIYAGNLVVGAGHLKSGSTQDDLDDRVQAAENIAYYIDYFFNGAGTGSPDPRNKILDSPVATSILSASTPVVIGGDWNEDELNNGRKGPAEWMTMTQTAGGTDGADRDRTDSTYDDARDPKNNSRTTLGSSKLDYIAWQDSIATLRRAFIFNAGTLSASPAWPYPPEVASMTTPSIASTLASDHRPVIADFVLPLITNPCAGYVLGDANCDGIVDNFDINPFVLALTNPAAWEAQYSCDLMCANDINGDGVIDNFDINPFVALLTGP